MARSATGGGITPGGWRLRGRRGQRVGDHDPSALQPVQPSQVEQRCAPPLRGGRSLQPLDLLNKRAQPSPTSLGLPCTNCPDRACAPTQCFFGMTVTSSPGTSVHAPGDRHLVTSRRSAGCTPSMTACPAIARSATAEAGGYGVSGPQPASRLTDIRIQRQRRRARPNSETIRSLRDREPSSRKASSFAGRLPPSPVGLWRTRRSTSRRPRPPRFARTLRRASWADVRSKALLRVAPGACATEGHLRGNVCARTRGLSLS